MQNLGKVIIDTSAYIPFIREGIFIPQIETEGQVLLYMSSVVMEELYAGAFDPKLVKALDRVFDTFTKVGRLVNPISLHWKESGKIIAKMGKKYGFEDIFLARLLNDCLIALTARHIGATVVAKDLKDFNLIKKYRSFSLQIL